MEIHESLFGHPALATLPFRFSSWPQPIFQAFVVVLVFGPFALPFIVRFLFRKKVRPIRVVAIVCSVILAPIISFLILRGLGTNVGAMHRKGKAVIVTGTVYHAEYEGGFYGVLGDDGVWYNPINLTMDLHVEGLRVKFKAKIRDDLLSYQGGRLVEISNLQVIGGTNDPNARPSFLNFR